MLIQANDRGKHQVFFNSNQVVQIIQTTNADLFNVYLVGDKIVQINAQTLKEILSR